MCLIQFVVALDPYLETYYEHEVMESAPYLVTNPAQPTSINDKLLVRPRLLFARTRSKDSRQGSGSEVRSSITEPDFAGKYASWSEYDRASSPSLHHVKRVPDLNSGSKSIILKPTESTKTVPSKMTPEIPQATVETKPDIHVKSAVENGVKQVFIQVHEVKPSQGSTREPVAVAGSESEELNHLGHDDEEDKHDEDSDDQYKSEEPNQEISSEEGLNETPEEVSKVDDEPVGSPYDEEAAKGEYPSSGYLGPEDNSIPDSSQHRNEEVPRYPPLDRDKLYNKSFLIYLKDFRPGQY